MIYARMADLVFLLHLSFIFFVMFGGIALLRWPRLAWLHLPAFLWGATVELAGWRCPLTPLEQWLRARAGEGGYAGDFVSHYVSALIYPTELTRTTQVIIGVLVLLWNGFWYLRLWQRKGRLK